MFSLLSSFFINFCEKPNILNKVNLWFFINNYLFKFKLLNTILILQLRLDKQKYKYLSLFYTLNYNFFNTICLFSLVVLFFSLII
jgi:hypothetical protein